MEDPQKEARQWCTGYALVFLFALLFAGGAFAQELENEVLDPREDTKPRPSVGDLPSQALKGPNAIVTDKGSQIQGKFEGIEGGRFVINDPQLGKIKVKSTDISSLLLGDPYRIWFQETNDSAVKEGRMSPVFYRDDLGDLRVRVHSFNESGLDEYLILDPSKLHKVSLSSYSLKPPEWKFTGNISAAFEWADGNRTRINYGYNTWFKLQHPSHIFDFRNDFLYAETDSIRSAQRGNAEFSYRFLFTTHNAVFYRQLFSHDDFAKLAVRSITSLGLTFYFYKEPTVTWYLDAGASYSEEHRKENIPNRYSDGGQISMKVDAKPTEEIHVVANTRATVPFDRPKESIITTDANVSFKVWREFTCGLNFRHNHDSQPPQGVEHNDYTVRFLLGWAFR